MLIKTVNFDREERYLKSILNLLAQVDEDSGWFIFLPTCHERRMAGVPSVLTIYVVSCERVTVRYPRNTCVAKYCGVTPTASFGFGYNTGHYLAYVVSLNGRSVLPVSTETDTLSRHYPVKQS